MRSTNRSVPLQTGKAGNMLPVIFRIALGLTALSILLVQKGNAATFPTNTSYYIGYINCSDSYTTSIASAPWCTFNNINGNIFSAGDHLYLQAGGTWNQELDLQGTGASNNLIYVDSYGSGAKPIIDRNDTTSGGELCVLLMDPDYWSINNLEVTRAGVGILVDFDSSGHTGVNLTNIYATGIQGFPSGNLITLGVFKSAGIHFSSPSSQTITLNPGQTDISNVYISNYESASNWAGLAFWDMGLQVRGQGGGANGTTTWAMTNSVFDNIYVHDSIASTSLGNPVDLSYVNNLTIMDSIFTNPIGHVANGTTDVESGLSNDIILINDQFTNIPDTDSNDGSGWDNELQNNGIQFKGSYFANTAGAGFEPLAIHSPDYGFPDYDSNNVLTSNLFVHNGTGSASKSGGAIYTVGSSDTPSGIASNNLYYEVGYAFNNSLPGFTFTNNLAADSASDTWNAYNGFSGVQGQNQWYYQYFNGSSYSNMATYTPSGTDGVWSVWGANNNTALIWGSRMRPDTCNSCLTSRVWKAPAAGNISIRGWLRRPLAAAAEW